MNKNIPPIRGDSAITKIRPFLKILAIVTIIVALALSVLEGSLLIELAPYALAVLAAFLGLILFLTQET